MCEPTFASPQDVFARLDELRVQRADAHRAEQGVLREIKKVLEVAGALRFDGEPINRDELIKHAGVARRTAYRFLPPLEDGDECSRKGQR